MKRLILFFVFALASGSGMSATVCNGQFPNPISDICWHCALPIKIGDFPLATASGETIDYDSTAAAGIEKLICQCPTSLGTIKTGIPISFWEYARQVDVTRTPYCLVGLGQLMNIGINGDVDAGKSTVTSEDPTAVFRHVHWYVNPLLSLMGAILDSKCLEPKGFDLAYVSELDRTWIDEEAARILAPEAYLFNNIVAQIACGADCVAASAGLIGMSDTLFWCAGCNGNLFPLDGWVSSTNGDIQTSALLVQRMTTKQHRMLTQFSTAGKKAMCGAGAIEPVMDKRQYKFSMIFPVPQANPSNGNGLGGTGSLLSSCCQPFGRTTLLWGSGRALPGKGEDFAYGIFRKRDCCQ